MKPKKCRRNKNSPTIISITVSMSVMIRTVRSIITMIRDIIFTAEK